MTTLFDAPAPTAPQSENADACARLRAALGDPAFRQTPGFPRGADDAILALSDPPHYTACPNPFLPEVVARWQTERESLRQALRLPPPARGQAPDSNGYHREPFAADVSEGKNDPIYNAHTYHTKVPHKAIMRYILHYTDPGDIVLDGFCGSGMTGVAAQLCADRRAVQSLGYLVGDDGVIYEGDKPISRLGARRAVLVDLSPAATFIAYNYNAPADPAAFEREAQRILAEVEEEYGWMYQTKHADGRTGRINYVVWSEVFRCPTCAREMAFWDVAVDQANGAVHEVWACPGCGASLSKSPPKHSGAQRAERVFDERVDPVLRQTVRQARYVPARINYTVGKQRFDKAPDADDLALLRRIEQSNIPYPVPTERMPEGDESRRNDDIGLTHVHHFYTKRNLWVLAALFALARRSPYKSLLLFWLNSFAVKTGSLLHNIGLKNARINLAGAVPNTLYIPSNIAERNILALASEKLGYLSEAGIGTRVARNGVAIATGSSHNAWLPDNSVDYIFVDPPFGSNLMYSELNFLWEAWLGVFTDNRPEAVVNTAQRKGLGEYQALMEACFRAFYRALKPGRWMTVEFHNSQNAVWNSIQEALLRAGFVVADVRTIDKQQGTFNQMNASGAVKQDLVISAYKPTAAFERAFQAVAGTPEGAWAFVRQHLAQVPVVVVRENTIEPIPERMPYLLFDRMVAFHIQRGLTVPLSAGEFYEGLAQRFLHRHGMYFLPTQTPEYDAAWLRVQNVGQLALYVSDEKTALQWLRRALDPQQGGAPKTYAEIQPEFLKVLHPARHEAMPELSHLLEENFIQDDEGRWRAPDPRKAADLEALRRKALLREFKGYLQGSGRLKQFRSEAVRAGFAEAYRAGEWETILKVAKRLPERALQEDSALLMYYDAASARAKER